MQKADNLVRCQIAAQYSDEQSFMYVPGYFEELEFKPVWERAVKGTETPDGWFCVGVFGGESVDQMVRIAKSAGCGISRSYNLKNKRQQ